MARPLQNLRCPFCHADRTSRAVRSPSAAKLERYYGCSNCGNEFTTVEKISRASLDGVLVLRPRTVEDRKDPAPKPFDPEVTESHLRLILRKLLTEQQRSDLLNVVMQELPQQLDSLERVHSDGPGGPWLREFSDRIIITAGAVRTVIETCMKREAVRSHPRLRPRYEAAHALYLMTAVNRSYQQVMQMLAREYPSKIDPAEFPTPSRAPVAEQWHYSPQFAAPHPQFVVKNFWHPIEVPASHEDHLANVDAVDVPAQREPRNRVLFSVEALDSSIAKALGSSPSALFGSQSLSRDEVVTNIREWVLWQLAGQKIVRSSQLSSEIAAVLRRCAPLPYLRWVTIGKELHVEEIFEEAASLALNPPVPLEFSPEAMARIHSQPTPWLMAGQAQDGPVSQAQIRDATQGEPLR